MKERQDGNAGQKAQVTQVDVDTCCVCTRTYSNYRCACPCIGTGIYKENRGIKVEYKPMFTPFILTFLLSADQRCVVVASQSSLIWEHGAVTAEHNDTTHQHARARAHTHTHPHNPSSRKQERSSCELHSSVQIEGDTGRLVNRHRCTELSRTESGRKRKVTLSQWEGSDKVNNTCCKT